MVLESDGVLESGGGVGEWRRRWRVAEALESGGGVGE